ncbi:hypothetical protein G7Y89_g3057 [Cudoniella acicularis]|uniref:STAS domain-containing protein n=1 Tax=Cudoniella acicularis TaxID=354080 RepID=A0A8H4RS45_9HELO|nr:hypothetical protein G7Y89_g3057 [Cudoniella acicularis]
MASEQSAFKRAARNLPVIRQYQEDTQSRRAQDTWFATQASDGFMEQKPTVLEYIKSIVPEKQGILQYVEDTFPCYKWLFNYNLQWFLGDVIAGVTVGAVVIPQGMAYSELAGLPVQYGLYTSFTGALCYWVFGTSKDINIGPVAVASIVTGAILSNIAADHPTESPETLAGTISMLAGGVIFAIGFLRLGWLADLLSLPAVSAFITGSAVTITFSQIPVMMGMAGISGRDPAFFIGLNILKHLNRIRIDAALGLTSLAMLYIIKWICSSVAIKRPKMAKAIFFVSTLRTVLILLFYTLVSYLVNRTRKDDPLFRILGFIPSGFHTAPPPKIEAKVLATLLSQTPAACIVLVIEHISIAKSFGRINNYTINPNSEFIAIGVTNLLGPLVGAYAATGSLSRSAINAKAGSRTPLAGVATAIVVLLALYTLTGMFFYVPRSALAAVIIHAIGDLVTPPSTLYEFWKISPLDFIIFVIGLSITIFDSIEHGIFATIGLSLAILVFRVFKAHGGFLGKVKVRSVKYEKEKWIPASSLDSDKSTDSSRPIFLPLNRQDGSNPDVEIERPYQGIFIYRFSEGFNYSNANNQLDHMATVILDETRPTIERNFEKPGDRSWNDPTLCRSKDPMTNDTRPTLKAIILDFSAVNNVDLTSIQTLIDIRNQLDRHAAPNAVQWHFACINNRWSKRALAAAGFGFPSFEADNGEPRHFKAIYSLAEMQDAGDLTAFIDPASNAKRRKSIVHTTGDVEPGDFVSREEKAIESHIEDAGASSGPPTSASAVRMATLHGINRPFFHPDLQSALVSATATEEFRSTMMEQAQELGEGIGSTDRVQEKEVVKVEVRLI